MFKKLIPGISLCLIIAVVAKFSAPLIPSLGGVSIAIVLGIIIGNILQPSQITAPGIRFCEKTVLELAIVFMGFNLQLNTLGSLGSKAFFIILPLMLITILTGLFVASRFGFNKRFGYLLGIGSAVCGSSAIAAVAPVLEAKEDEIGISVSVVNLMGAIGIFLLPPLVHILSMNDIQSAYMVGGTLQAIGHVVAAGFSINETVGDTATVIKMLRVLMIGPIVVIMSIMLRKKTATSGKLSGYIPLYIVGFIACSLIATVLKNHTEFVHSFKLLAKYLLMIAMAGVGMKIRFADLLREGPKAIMAIVIIFAVQLAATVGLIKIFNP